MRDTPVATGQHLAPLQELGIPAFENRFSRSRGRRGPPSGSALIHSPYKEQTSLRIYRGLQKILFLFLSPRRFNPRSATLSGFLSPESARKGRFDQLASLYRQERQVDEFPAFPSCYLRKKGHRRGIGGLVRSRVAARKEGPKRPLE